MPVYKEYKTITDEVTGEKRKVFKGTYYYKINLKGSQTGKRGFLTLEEAESAMYLEMSKLSIGGRILKENIEDINSDSLDEAFKMYLITKYKSATARKYYSVFENHVKPFFKNTDIRKINNLQLTNFSKYLLKLDYQSKDVILDKCKLYLDFLERHGSVKLDRSLLTMPYNSNKREKDVWDFYTLDEFRQFCSVIDSKRDLLMFNLLFYYGLRIGELRALRHKSFDLVNNKFMITKAITNKTFGKGDELIDPKTTNSIRTNELLPHIKEMYIKLFKKRNKKQFIFSNGKNILAESSIRRLRIKYAELAKLKVIRTHDFRHSCCTFLLNNGMDYLQVAEWVGDKPDTVLKYYAHLIQDRKKAIVDLFNKVSS